MLKGTKEPKPEAPRKPRQPRKKKVSAAVASLVEQFEHGVKLEDKEGRVVTSLQASDDGLECLVAFHEDDMEWTHLAATSLRPQKVERADV